MPGYIVDFANQTKMVLTLCVYQIPNGCGQRGGSCSLENGQGGDQRIRQD